jgi:hypothetical protein
MFHELPNTTLRTLARQHEDSTVIDEPLKKILHEMILSGMAANISSATT